MQQKRTAWLAALLSLLVLAGCGQAPAAKSAEYAEVISLADEAVALAEMPAVPLLLEPAASGTLVKENTKAVIDYSNTADGYIMVKYTASTTKKLKARVTGPSGTAYTYNLAADAEWTTFPLSDGDGSYQAAIFENVSGNKYANALSATFSVTLTDAFAPFLRPNQYVDYTQGDKSVEKAAELTAGMTDPLDKVEAVYTFVVKNLTYDKQKAATVQSGYLPVLDTVLAEKKGICFDYAALMTGMLRSQGVPCKLVVGYAGTVYHAWISVYSEKTGWVDAAIYFDGTSWNRMDPTFASSGKQSTSIMQYIGDGSHYTAKYLY